MGEQQAQLKPQAEVAFNFKKAPRQTTRQMLPQITWEVPPLDFEIPDEPMDNFDQSLLAEALRDAPSCIAQVTGLDEAEILRLTSCS